VDGLVHVSEPSASGGFVDLSSYLDQAGPSIVALSANGPANPFTKLTTNTAHHHQSNLGKWVSRYSLPGLHGRSVFEAVEHSCAQKKVEDLVEVGGYRLVIHRVIQGRSRELSRDNRGSREAGEFQKRP
jgi:hypothetical protein